MVVIVVVADDVGRSCFDGNMVVCWSNVATEDTLSVMLAEGGLVRRLFENF